MIKIDSDPGQQIVALQEEKPCYMQIAECIAAIWRMVCDWIFPRASMPPANLNDISCTSPDAFANVMKYLLSEEVGRCETVCKAWKVSDKVWKAKCKQEHVSYTLEEGKHKRAFSHPRPPLLAFGVNAWKKYFADPGVAPRLPSTIHRTFFKRQRTHTLTLVPKTVDGKPFCLDAFIPLAVKQGVLFNYARDVREKWGKSAQDKSIWVWMAKKAHPESGGITQARAKNKCAGMLGRARWIVLSIVAHNVRFKERLFSSDPISFTRAIEFGGDGDRRWCVIIGHFALENRLRIVKNDGESDPKIGVARCYPV